MVLSDLLSTKIFIQGLNSSEYISNLVIGKQKRDFLTTRAVVLPGSGFSLKLRGSDSKKLRFLRLLVSGSYDIDLGLEPDILSAV